MKSNFILLDGTTESISKVKDLVNVDIPERIYDTTFPHINFCVTEYYEEYIKNIQL
jgi:hypothetical protein